MAQADGVVANGTGAAVRSDLNGQLAALFTNHSGSTSPGTTYAHQFWADTNENVLKIRNGANDAWITLRELDGTMLIEDGSASSPGLAFADDVNTGLFSSAANKINFATAGVERLVIGENGVVFNDPGNDVNFRVESSNNDNMLFVDAGNDRVGVGSSSPNGSLSIQADSGRLLTFRNSTTGTGTSDGSYITLNGSDLQISNAESANTIFYTGDTERARIDSSGRLLINTTNGVELIHGVGGGLKLARNKTGNPTSGQSLMSVGFHGIGDTNSNGAAEAKIEAFAAENHSGTTAASQLRFYTKPSGTGPGSSPTERLRIQSDGAIQLRNSPGIDFSQIQTNTSGVISETLDSYEEGSFTCTFSNADNNVVGSGLTETAYYIKIGHFVHFNVYFNSVTITSTGTSTAGRIRGLPFTERNVSENYATVSFTYNTAFTSSSGGYVNVNDTTIIPVDDGTASPSTISTFSGKKVMITGTYYAA